jgi:hypothetical protein
MLAATGRGGPADVPYLDINNANVTKRYRYGDCLRRGRASHGALSVVATA